MTAYSVTRLRNGYVLILHRRSGLSGLYEDDGTYHSGDFKVGRLECVNILLDHDAFVERWSKRQYANA